MKSEPAAERLDSVRKPDQPCADHGLGASDTVVDDGCVEPAALELGRDRHGDRLGVRVLRCIRQSLGDDVVDGCLDRLRGTFVEVDLELDRNRGAASQPEECYTEAEARELRRMQAARG